MINTTFLLDANLGLTVDEKPWPDFMAKQGIKASGQSCFSPSLLALRELMSTRSCSAPDRVSDRHGAQA